MSWRRRLRSTSLVVRLVGHFLVLSITFVVAAGVLTYFAARQALHQSVVDRLSVFAALEEDQLHRWLESQREEVIHMASLPEVQDLAAELLPAASSTNSGASSNALKVAEKRLRRIFAGAVEVHSSFQDIFCLAAAGGKVVVATRPKLEGQYRIRDSFFAEGLFQTYVQNVYPSPIALGPALTVSTPLRSENGELLGVLAANLDLDELDRITQSRLGLGESGETYLVDKYNVFVSGTRFGRDRFPRGVHTRGIDAAVAGEDGSALYENYEGRPVIGVYRWLEDLDLALLVEVGQHEAFAPADRIALVILAVGLTLAALLAVGTVILARQIARPVLKMTDTALQVARGDLSARVEVTTADEVGVLAQTFNNMTERLQQVDAELREEIADRKKTQDELEAKNAELEQFTYTVSHDLKSPLVTIQGFIGLLERDATSGKTKLIHHYIGRIRTAAGKLGRLLDELLELSRVGRIVNPSEDVDMNALIDEVRELLVGSIEAAGAEIEVEADLPMVHGDRLRLREIFQNLIDNALKFATESSPPRIEIGIHQDSEAAAAVFFVRDNGPGIPTRYHDRVFRLFERLDPSIDGTGVGLTLVKRIIEAHGGNIWVESEDGLPGTTFCFTLTDPL